MATGQYGTIRSADVRASDVEIFYVYQDTPNSLPSTPVQLNSNILSPKNNPNNTNEVLGGLYDLRLPSNIFNKKGTYTLIIRPRRIRANILDCGVLSNDTTIRGLVLNINSISAQDRFLFENNNLIGYRIEYLNTQNQSDKKIRNKFTIVTSNSKVEAVSENLENTSSKSIRYRLNDNSTLSFLALTPSLSTNLTPNNLPFIGSPNQEILISNTYFNPTTVRVNLVENDFDTLALGLYGDQIFNISNGRRTYFDENGEIFKQFDEYVVKEEISGNDLYEVKKESNDIDYSESLDNVTQ